jgi:hypothetical protein
VNNCRYLTYKKDNNELLLYILKGLATETAIYMRNRYRKKRKIKKYREKRTKFAKNFLYSNGWGCAGKIYEVRNYKHSITGL